MNKAIILDRDGTINVEKDYLHKIEDFEYIKGVIEGLKIFKDLGYKIIVVTNQSGVARGYYTEEDVIKLHEFVKEDLRKKGIEISKFYYCPHHPEKGIGKYKKDCNCRKPKTGMLDDAIKDFDIDINNSFMVGDKVSDVKAGLNVGLAGVLVKTGHGSKEEIKMQGVDGLIFENLLDFAKTLKK